MRSLPRSILIISGLVLAVALAVAVDASPWIRGGFGWRWPYIPVDLSRVLPLFVVTVTYLGGGWLLLQRSHRPVWTLLWAMVGSAVIAFTLAYTRDGDAIFSLFARTASGMTTGPHWAAARIDWAGGAWQDWTTVMGDLGGHLGTAPPGAPMLVGLFNDLFQGVPAVSDSLQAPLFDYQCQNYDMLTYSPSEWASAWTGILMPLWAGLTVFPVYGLARRIRPEGDARHAALWWALVPGIAAFAASWSTLYPLLSASALWVLVVALGQPSALRCYGWGFGAGVVAGIGTFINFALLPTLGVCGLYTLLDWWLIRRKAGVSFRQTVQMGIAFGLGVLLPWVLFWLAGGDDPLAILQASFDYHLDLDRPYEFWVFFHVWDFALWTGIGLTLLMGLAVWRWWQDRSQSEPPILALTTILTILIMTLSGTTQGESGRIWLFMSPFVVVAAWDGLNRITAQDNRSRGWLALTVTQALIALAITANYAVIGSELTPRPQPPAFTAANPLPSAATFRTVAAGDTFRLTGFAAEHIDDVIQLSLRWEGVQPTDAPLWFGALLVGPDGTSTGMTLWQPREIDGNAARYPTTCWEAGTIIGDVVNLPLPDDTVNGDWWVSLAAFGEDNTTEGRLPVILADGTEDIQVGLGPIPVDASSGSN